jgi:hypothetical protein
MLSTIFSKDHCRIFIGFLDIVDSLVDSPWYNVQPVGVCLDKSKNLQLHNHRQTNLQLHTIDKEIWLLIAIGIDQTVGSAKGPHELLMILLQLIKCRVETRISHNIVGSDLFKYSITKLVFLRAE